MTGSLYLRKQCPRKTVPEEAVSGREQPAVGDESGAALVLALAVHGRLPRPGARHSVAAAHDSAAIRPQSEAATVGHHSGRRAALGKVHDFMNLVGKSNICHGEHIGIFPKTYSYKKS